MTSTSTEAIYNIIDERDRQDAKWGPQNHPDGTSEFYRYECDQRRQLTDANFAAGRGTWRDVLLEEVAEAMAEVDPVKLREELVQVAAVAVAWIEAIDRRP